MMKNKTMKIPFFGVDRQYKQYHDDFLSIFDTTLSSGQVLQGESVKLLERKLCKICQRSYAVTLGSCTDALAFSLIASGIGPGDQILVTPFTFIATVSAILRVGATPFFVDIEPQYYMMAIDRIDDCITKQTKALIAVHLFGQALPIYELEKWSDQYDIKIIEDAAQSFGSYYDDRPVGSLGDISCLSFDPTKNIGSFGSAGSLLTDDPSVYEYVKALRYHGLDPETRQYNLLGYNSQMPTMMAAVLSFKLSKMEKWNKRRGVIAQRYIDELRGVREIVLPATRPSSKHIWHKFVLRVAQRNELMRFMYDRGVSMKIHYSRLLCDEPLIRDLKLPKEAVNVPVARDVCKNVVSLPIYPELTDEEVEYIILNLLEFYNK